MATEIPRWVYGSKSSFAAGELTPTIEGRSDLPLYQNGAKKIINWMILPSGGLTRRPGTEFVWGKKGSKLDTSPPDVPMPGEPVPTAQDLASRLFRLKKKLNERAGLFDYAAWLTADNGECSLSSLFWTILACVMILRPSSCSSPTSTNVF